MPAVFCGAGHAVGRSPGRGKALQGDSFRVHPAYAYLKSSFLVGRAFLPAEFLIKRPPEPETAQSSGGLNLCQQESFPGVVPLEVGVYPGVLGECLLPDAGAQDVRGHEKSRIRTRKALAPPLVYAEQTDSRCTMHTPNQSRLTPGMGQPSLQQC